MTNDDHSVKCFHEYYGDVSKINDDYWVQMCMKAWPHQKHECVFTTT